MKYSKQTVIEGLKHSIEKTKEEIEKYSTKMQWKVRTRTDCAS